MKIIIYACLIFFTLRVSAKGEISYVKKNFIHLHKNESVHSLVLITLACGQPVKVLKKSKGSYWAKVKSGKFAGYILKRHISNEETPCFSSDHSKVFNKLDLSIHDLYKMGRLEDLFIEGKIEL